MTTPASPLRERLRRIAPYFASAGAASSIALVGSVVGALTEPVIPLLLKGLLDKGFQLDGVPLWAVPVAMIGLTSCAALAGFVAQYGMAWAANRGVLEMRSGMFGRLLDAQPALFTRSTASSLTNTLIFEVQNGATQLVYALLTLVRDSLTPVAHARGACSSSTGSSRWSSRCCCRRSRSSCATTAGACTGSRSRRRRRPTTSAYVVEENVLAWNIVRLHAAGGPQAERFRARQRAAAPALAQGGDRLGDDDADHPGAGVVRAGGGDHRGALAERPRRGARSAASSPSSPRCCS